MADSAAHRRAVRKAFDQAAGSYDAAAGVQRDICERLAAFAALHRPASTARRVLDAGCGTGYGLPLLAAAHPGAEIVAVDFAPAMLSCAQSLHTRANATAVCADLEALPLADACCDGIWSSLALQWCETGRALAEFRRVLKPGGAAWIATLAPGTLSELRDAFSAVDDLEHVRHFPAVDRWLSETRTAGFDIVAQTRETTRVLAPDLRGIVRHIKGIGAHRVGGAPRPPLRRADWRALEARYARYRRDDGMLPASYDVLLLVLKKA